MTPTRRNFLSAAVGGAGLAALGNDASLPPTRTLQEAPKPSFQS